MRTIDQNYTHEIEIKNSHFICYLFAIESDAITELLEKVKSIHPKATHCCYAYIYDDIKHSSDDGEPSGTAGFPILNVLEKEGLNHIICIVVRYFGGIKLGAGGLVRAYTKSVTETLKICNFVELVLGYKIKIQFPYDEENTILYLLNQSVILERNYLEDITYTVLVDQELYQKLFKYKPIIVEEKYIKKLN